MPSCPLMGLLNKKTKQIHKKKQLKKAKLRNIIIDPKMSEIRKVCSIRKRENFGNLLK
jgi:hypothetical protein